MITKEAKEFQNNLQFKLQENVELNEKLQLTEDEIIEKKEEIEKLKQKFGLLLGAEG
jgi:hypothetical protein